jgi:uncharacterized membrane protein
MEDLSFCCIFCNYPLNLGQFIIYNKQKNVTFYFTKTFNMNFQKFLIGTVVGGVTLFLLGYVFYGAALADFFSKHVVAGSMKPMNAIVWWALILGNLSLGALLTYIFLKMGNVQSFGTGVRIGAIIGFLMNLGGGLISHATANSLDRAGAIADVLVGTVMTAIASGVIVVILAMGKKKA